MPQVRSGRINNSTDLVKIIPKSSDQFFDVFYERPWTVYDPFASFDIWTTESVGYENHYHRRLRKLTELVKENPQGRNFGPLKMYTGCSHSGRTTFKQNTEIDMIALPS
jgi:hypothetical protein